MKRIQFLNALPLAWLPNSAGFRFVGIRHNGSTVACEVIKREDGLHTVRGDDGTTFAELSAWKRIA